MWLVSGLDAHLNWNLVVEMPLKRCLTCFGCARCINDNDIILRCLYNVMCHIHTFIGLYHITDVFFHASSHRSVAGGILLKPSQNRRSRFFENRTAETEFWVFEFWGQFGSVFKKPISEIFIGFRTPLDSVKQTGSDRKFCWPGQADPRLHSELKISNTQFRPTDAFGLTSFVTQESGLEHVIVENGDRNPADVKSVKWAGPSLEFLIGKDNGPDLSKINGLGLEVEFLKRPGPKSERAAPNNSGCGLLGIHQWNWM